MTERPTEHDRCSTYQHTPNLKNCLSRRPAFTMRGRNSPRISRTRAQAFLPSGLRCLMAVFVAASRWARLEGRPTSGCSEWLGPYPVELLTKFIHSAEAEICSRMTDFCRLPVQMNGQPIVLLNSPSLVVHTAQYCTLPEGYSRLAAVLFDLRPAKYCVGTPSRP